MPYDADLTRQVKPAKRFAVRYATVFLNDHGRRLEPPGVRMSQWKLSEFVPLVWEKSYGHCWYCGVLFVEPRSKLPATHPRQFSVDHIVPLKMMGSNDLSNLVPCCRECNRLKGVNTLDEFRSDLYYRKHGGLEKLRNAFVAERELNKGNPEWRFDPPLAFRRFWFEEVGLTP